MADLPKPFNILCQAASSGYFLQILRAPMIQGQHKPAGLFIMA